jgi:hypothetical protein
MRLSPCVLVQPDGWARGEREGYGEPCDVTSLSLFTPSVRRSSYRFALQLTQHAPKTHYHASDSIKGSSGTSFKEKNRCLTSLP